MGSEAPFSPNVSVFGTVGQLGTLFDGKLPVGGTIDPNFVPQPSQLLGFVDPTTGMPTADTNMLPVFSGLTFSFTGLATPQHFVVPNTQQWNLSVQRSLPKEWVVELGYVGTKATHLSDLLDPMQAKLASPQNPISVPDAFGNMGRDLDRRVGQGALRLAGQASRLPSAVRRC